MKTIEYIPKKGLTASYYLPTTGKFVDVKVNNVIRFRLAEIEFPDGGTRTVPITELEKPMAVDVNERFDYFRQLSELVITKKLRSLLVTGEGAIGKSHTVLETLEYHELEEGKDFLHLKGSSTARALYDILRNNDDKLFILDDFDAVLTDPQSQNILKAALDTYQKRMVHWLTARGGRGENSFEFHGAIIFLSNKRVDQIPQPILSRSIVVDLYMTVDEKIGRMEFLLPSLDCVKLELSERLKVLRLIDRYKNTIQNLNLRTLIKALIVYENTENLELVKYQIFQG